MGISERERRAQAMARDRLDAEFVNAERRILRVIEIETSDLVFGFLMNASADLSREKVDQVRAILQAFRRDREIATRMIVKIRRREIAVLLQEEPRFEDRCLRFDRWSRPMLNAGVKKS